MPDPWLSQEELDEHNKEVENHPLTKIGKEIEEENERNEKELEEERREERKQRKEEEKEQTKFHNQPEIAFEEQRAWAQPTGPESVAGSTEPAAKTARRGRQPKAVEPKVEESKKDDSVKPNVV